MKIGQNVLNISGQTIDHHIKKAEKANKANKAKKIKKVN
jgi:hypothetical protein